MIRESMLIVTAMTLAGCGGAMLGGRLAAGAMIVRGAGATGVAEGAAAARFAAARLSVSPTVATGASGSIGSALRSLAHNRGSLVIEKDGLIWAGGNGVARFAGSDIVVGSRAVATLRQGVLYSLESGVAVGRLRGAIPGTGVPLELANGSLVPTARVMIIDVLELTAGRYLVRLASGETAWVTAGLATIVLVAAVDAQDCNPAQGTGLLVRVSGEPIPFDACERTDDAYLLSTAGGMIAIAASEPVTITSDELADLLPSA